MSEVLAPALLSSEELGDLQFAARCLDGRGFAARLTAALGRQVEALGRALPSPARRSIARAAERALKAALRLAVRTIDENKPAKAAKGAHKAAAAASGALGGAFGLASAAIELPISTTILLRSIAEIAR